MEVFSKIKPVLLYEKNYELEAISILPALTGIKPGPITETNVLIVFMLVQYESLNPENIITDSLYFHLDELLDDAEELYGISRDSWRNDFTNYNESIDNLVYFAAKVVAKESGLNKFPKFLARNETIPT